MVLRARPVAIEVAETPPCHASMTRAVPPIEICGVAKVAADGTERFRCNLLWPAGIQLTSVFEDNQQEWL
jgi:hypothetical protein